VILFPVLGKAFVDFIFMASDFWGRFVNIDVDVGAGLSSLGFGVARL
jgi:hypothetical protein